ncbi:DUF3261 domain-containing protein [Kushneria marisflavi]|uniref:Uncharacterized protein n=1 Tax=Kushneria marisflavi TaxID=157779 RepID=A0A240US36_9GAMM|nr:DUF3261 domain-containing protein [Kushneria marisflavi]ART63852.1 hypothetical protein B9H00_12970 [Kushneria marisflavi]RKD85557.1 uncharacterized protein DUF3261 [Kushneria marisflavi]
MTALFMSRRLWPAALLLMLTLLAGCGVPAMAPQSAPGWQGETQTLKRKLTITPFDASRPEQTLLSVIRLSDQGMRVVIATPTGQRLFTLVRDDQGARYTQSIMDEPPFPAKWFAQRLEWSLRPEADLQAVFKGSTWRVQDQRFEHGRVREILDGDTLMARIDTIDHPTDQAHDVLTDFQIGYRMVITPFGNTQNAGKTP